MRFFCDIHDYQGRGKIFRKKNYDQSSNRVKHCCEKKFLNQYGQWKDVSVGKAREKT